MMQLDYPANQFSEPL